MSGYAFKELVDLTKVRRLMESHHRLSGMAYGLFDADENNLIAVGWQEICTRFHRVNPVSCARCRESDAYIKEQLHNLDGDFIEYRCGNGLIDVAFPIVIDGHHLATFFTGQFFYDDQLEMEYYLMQADALGFDPADYIKALKRVPIFSREHVHSNLLNLRDIVGILTRCGFNNLMLTHEVEVRRRTEEALRESELRYREVFDNVSDCLFLVDVTANDRFRIAGFNPANEKTIGIPSEDAIGKYIEEVVPCPAAKTAVDNLHRCMQEGTPVQYENQLSLPTGQRHFNTTLIPVRDSSASIYRIVGVAQDITGAKAYQEQLHAMAFFDSLTALPNRTLFNDRLRQAVAETARSKFCIGIMILDLDNFKTVNDTLGHAAGDLLLCDAGKRIRQCVRENDTVARLGGDEFALILTTDVLCKVVDLGTVARKILTAFAAPFSVKGRDLFISVSIGIACYPTNGRDITELVQYADAAMYHAKSRGRNNFQFYTAELTVQAEERLALEVALRKAVMQGELEVHYQSKIDLGTDVLVGAEALLRWTHPQWGEIPPNRFIGIAEDTGMIVEIGEWVLRTACLAVQRWNHGTEVGLKVAVNLSARQFTVNDLVGTVRRILAETSCRPEWLEFEITESLLLDDHAEIRDTLDELHAMGITFAIDDFGTGYSALSYLTRFPIDTLKIDRSFVCDITTNERSAELAKAIISLACVLGMDLVAEGVETSAQAACLGGLGCHHGQGYLYSRPIPGEQFEALLDGLKT